MSEGSPPRLVPFNVVGILREKVRAQAVTIATLEAKNTGMAAEIDQLRAALERRSEHKT